MRRVGACSPDARQVLLENRVEPRELLGGEDRLVIVDVPVLGVFRGVGRAAQYVQGSALLLNPPRNTVATSTRRAAAIEAERGSTRRESPVLAFMSKYSILLILERVPWGAIGRRRLGWGLTTSCR